MITIYFESHGTTTDNQAGLASGWNDPSLSVLGEKQSKEMATRYKEVHLDVVFPSDQKRAVQSAEIAFKAWGVPIIPDTRLRECNYGDLNGTAEQQVKPLKPAHIKEPFPNGESYEQTTKRMKSFLTDLLHNNDGKTVMIVGSRATQYGLENLINKVPLEVIIPAKWSWQPGWVYKLFDV